MVLPWAEPHAAKYKIRARWLGNSIFIFRSTADSAPPIKWAKTSSLFAPLPTLLRASGIESSHIYCSSISYCLVNSKRCYIYKQQKFHRIIQIMTIAHSLTIQGPQFSRARTEEQNREDGEIKTKMLRGKSTKIIRSWEGCEFADFF